jgi:septum formation protein
MSAFHQPLILASRSPRRRQLLAEAGYDFRVIVPNDIAECGLGSHETPREFVGRLAYQKARDVAMHLDEGLVLGCDTVAECCGQILGKPKNQQHARDMLQLLRGRDHHVYSGICLWQRPTDETDLQVAVTKLHMEHISDEQLEAYLESHLWEGKAGAFGYQDRLDWLTIIEGSESNVVGLPLELLAEMLTKVPE